MKKYLLSLCLLAAGAGAASAQALYGYTLGATGETTYTPVTGGTTIFDGATTTLLKEFYNCVFTPEGVAMGDQTTRGFEIGFDVKFNGSTYNRFVAGGSGYVQLGNGEFEVYPSASRWPFNITDAMFVAMAPQYGMESDASSKVVYAVSGTAPNRRLTVEFADVQPLASMWDDAPQNHAQLQFVFKEQGGIDIVTKGFSAMSDRSYSVNAGLHGAAEDELRIEIDEEGKVSLNQSGSSFSWETSFPQVFGISLNYPGACAVPSAQPTELVLESTATSFEGSFTASESADTYLVTIAPAGSTAVNPVNATTYAAGDQLGDATVVAYGASTEFTAEDLTPSTQYVVRVYAAGAYGTDGPVYLTASPLELTVFTAPEQPRAFTAKGASVSTASLDVTGNDAGDQVIVVMSTEIERDSYRDHALVGKLNGQYMIGDQVEGGGTVVYMGAPVEVFTVPDLQASTPYFFVAYSYNATTGLYSAEGIESDAFTYITAPWTLDFAAAPRYEMPAQWVSDPASSSDFRVAFNRDDVGYLECTGSKGVTGGVKSFTTSVVKVDEWTGAEFSVDYNIVENVSRFAKQAYNDWAENDYLRLEVSDDGGSTFTTVKEYTPANNPKQEELESVVNITADLSAYKGKDVLVRLAWDCHSAASFGTKMTVSKISAVVPEAPEVPILRVASVETDAVLLEWRSSLNKFGLYVREKGSDQSTYSEPTNMYAAYIADLTPETEYEAWIVGLYPDYSKTASSNIVSFTTGNYPAVDPPFSLRADLSDFPAEGKVTLRWNGTEEMNTYNVHYRSGDATEYTEIENLTEEFCVITDLEPSTLYLWSVRANCTHNRVTEWANQSEFTTPARSGIATVGTGLTVSGNHGCVVIENHSGVVVERVVVADLAGRVIADKAVGSADNALLATGFRGNVVVTLTTAAGNVTAKLAL